MPTKMPTTAEVIELITATIDPLVCTDSDTSAYCSFNALNALHNRSICSWLCAAEI